MSLRKSAEKREFVTNWFLAIFDQFLHTSIKLIAKSYNKSSTPLKLNV